MFFWYSFYRQAISCPKEKKKNEEISCLKRAENFFWRLNVPFRKFKKKKKELIFKKIVYFKFFKKNLGPDPDTATPRIRIRNTGHYTKLSYVSYKIDGISQYSCHTGVQPVKQGRKLVEYTIYLCTMYNCTYT